MKDKLIYSAALLTLCLLAACSVVPQNSPSEDPDPPRQEAPAVQPEQPEQPEDPPKTLPEPPEQTEEERQAEFLALLDQVNTQRRAIYDDPEPPRLEEGWMPDLTELDGMFAEEQMKALMTHPGGTTSAFVTQYISAEAIAEDVETAFSLLKHSYGAYDYFGGDEVFLPIKQEVLEALPQEGLVSSRELEAALADHLAPVLVDGHFMVGSTPMRNSHIKYMYYVDGLYFDDADGIDPALLKPTIDGDGRMRFCLAVLASPEEAEALPEALTIQGIDMALSWRQDTWSFHSGPDIFTESALPDGTPLLTSTAMFAGNDSQQAQLDRLAACGAEYAGAPVLVLDVRGNVGGSDQYINDWFQGYTGQPASIRGAYAQKRSPLNRHIFASWEMDLPDRSEWYGYSSPGRFLEHSGVTLVLQDKGVASSGETAVGNLRTLENTLFIGGSTLGCTLTPNNFRFYLPNSGLDLYFGTCLLLTDDGENREGRGFSPDLWVPSQLAADRAEKLIAYYGLSNIFQ